MDDVARRAQEAFAKATAGAWLLATGADLQWPETAGEAGGDGPAERAVRKAFNDVNQLVKPAASLFAPPVAWRVLTARKR